MSRNPPVLNYFGGKASSAHKYPAPKYPLIIEPFAGGAGYSLLHRAHDVVLNDLSDPVVRAWQYLIGTSAAELLALPMVGASDDLRQMPLSAGARALIGFSLGCDSAPRNRRSPFYSKGGVNAWGEERRALFASIAESIRHWIICQADYQKLPDCEATWFIDPPYEIAGKRYNRGVNYAALGAWCKSRRGQVIVCENQGATWLPFDHVIENRPSTVKNADGTARRRVEVMFYQESP